MAKPKKPVHRIQMTEGKHNIIHQLLEEYDIQMAEDIQDALKDFRCIVHQVRNMLKYVSDKDKKTFATDLEPIYQASDKKKALTALAG